MIQQKMRLSLTGWLVLVNAIGAVVYLIVASRLWWIEPEVADIPGASGGSAFIWFPVSVYFCATFIAVNLAGLLRHLFVLFKKRGQKLSLYALATPAIWLIAVWIDFRHH
jgi:hypothetical protein